MTLVIDAGVVVAALVDDGPHGRWAEKILVSGPLAAPHLMPVEVANVLRRACLAGTLGADSAQLAHADLLKLRVVLFGYEPVAERVWSLRGAVTTNDACYVALAEALDAPLATIDLRLSRAPGPRCVFETPSTTE
ncbi:MAG: VapC toxin family PIN domain ribonuclease [Pseudonocardiales bacterium]|nr:MAG: VapC toxin family PIN domain ribonuclease [Pseudonocardiales bacterium]